MTAAVYAGSSACSNFGRRHALIESGKPGVLIAVEFAPDGYTPSDQRHICRVAS